MLCYSNNTLPPFVRQATMISELVVSCTLLIGGIFILLAALQVLPHGVNALSQIGIWGIVIGSATCLLGVTGSGLGIVHVLINGKKKILSKLFLSPTKEKVRLPTPPRSKPQKDHQPTRPSSLKDQAYPLGNKQIQDNATIYETDDTYSIDITF